MHVNEGSHCVTRVCLVSCLASHVQWSTAATVCVAKWLVEEGTEMSEYGNWKLGTSLQRSLDTRMKL